MPTLGTVAGQVRLDVRQAVAGYTALRAANAQTLYALRSGGAVFGAIGKASMAGGLLVAVGLGKAITAAAEFERRLDFFGAVSDSTAKQMEAIRAKALQLGRDTIYSANQVADSFVELGKAGVSAQDILKGVGEGVTSLGAAADIPLTQAANIMLAAVQTFSLKASDAVHVADLLAGAANASTVEVSDLGVSLKYAGGVAAGMHIPIEQVITALGMLGKAGIRGSTAGTSLRQVLIGLTGSTGPAHDALKKLGIITKDGANQFFTAQGKIKPLDQVIQTLADHTKGLTDQQKLVALKDVFNTRALPSVIALLNQGQTGWSKMNAEISKTTAAEVAHKRLDNLSGDLEILRGNIETIFIQTGSPFQSVLRSLVQGITSLTGAFSKLSPQTQKNIFQWVAIAGGVMLAVGAFSLAINGVLGFIGIIIRLVISLRTAFKLFQAGIAFVRGFMAVFATNPIGIAILAIAALAAGLVILYQRSATARAIMDAVWAGIQQGASIVSGYAVTAFQALVSLLQGFLPTLQGFGSTIASVFSTVVSAVSSFVSGLNFGNIISQIGQFVTSFGTLNAIVGVVIGFLAKLGAAFMQYLGGVLPWIQGTFLKVFQDLGSQLSGVWTQLQAAGSQIAAAFTGQLLPALSQLWTSVQQLLPALKVIGIVLAVAVGAAILVVVVAIAALLPPLVLLAAKILALAGPVLGLFISALQIVISVVTAVFTAMVGVISGAITTISGLIHLVVGLVTGDWAQAWQGAQQIVSGIWTAISSIVMGGVNAVIGIVSGFVSGVIKFFTNLWDVLVGHSIVPDMINAIVRWFAQLPGRVLGLVAGMIGSVIAAFARMAAGVGSAVANAVSRVVSGFANIVSAAARGAVNVVSAVARGLASLGSKFVAAMAAGVRAIASGGASAVSTAVGIAGRIVGAFAGLAGQMAGIGSNIIGALAGGIRAAAGAAASAAASVAHSAISAAKGALGIHSPSKVFTTLGYQVVKGFAIGLSKKLSVKVASIGMAKQSVISVGDYFKVYSKPLGATMAKGIAAGFSANARAIQSAVAGVIGSASSQIRAMPAAFRDFGELAAGNLGQQFLGTAKQQGPGAQTAVNVINSMMDAYTKGGQAYSNIQSSIATKQKSINDLHKKAKEIQHDINVAEKGKTTGKGKDKKTVVNKEHIRDLKNQLKSTQAQIRANQNLINSYKRQAAAIQKSPMMNARTRANIANSVIAGGAMLDALATQRDALATKLDAANQKLADAISARDEFAASVKNAITNFGSLLSLTATDPDPRIKQAADAVTSAQQRLDRANASYGVGSEQAAKAASDLAAAQQHQADVAQQAANSTTAANKANNITATDMVKQLQDRLAATKAFIANINALKAAGLNNGSLQELIAAGPEQAGAYAQALVDGGKTAITQINDIEKQLGSLGVSFGNTTAGWFYQAGVNAAQGVVNGLKAQENAITAEMNKIALAMVATIKQALKIKSPSRVMRDLFKHVPAGAVVGIASGIRDVERQSQALANAASTYGPSIDWSNRLGAIPTARSVGIMPAQSGGGQVVHQTINNQLTAITEARPSAIMDEFAWNARVRRLG